MGGIGQEGVLATTAADFKCGDVTGLSHVMLHAFSLAQGGATSRA